MGISSSTVSSPNLSPSFKIPTYLIVALLDLVIGFNLNIGVVLSADDSSGDINSGATGIQVVVSPDLIVFADASAACTVGTSYAVTGGSGAMYVNQSANGDYSLYCIAVSPNGFGHDGDASTGLFVLKNTGTSV